AGVAGDLPLPASFAATVQLDDPPVGGDQRVAVGQAGDATGAGDVRLPDDLAGCVDFDDAPLAGVGHQEAVAGQVLDADPEALRQRHLADRLGVDIDLDDLGVLRVDNVTVTVLANRVRPGDRVLPDPLA